MSGGRTYFFSPPLTVSYPLGCLLGRRGRYVNNPVEVSAKSPMPVALALDELDEALLLEQVQVALDGPRAARETLGEGLHAGPAEAGFVVGVVCEGAVGGDHLCGYSRQDQVAYLRYTGESGSNRHDQPPEGLATGPPW